jgi:hypothetical protein
MRFWILAAAWLLAVAVATPAMIEMADRRGIGLQIPGLSVTASEIVVAAATAVVPIVIGLLWLGRRRRS